MEIKGFLEFAGRGGWGSGNTKPEDFGGKIFNTWVLGGRSVSYVRLPTLPPRARLRISEAPLTIKKLRILFYVFYFYVFKI